MVIPRARIYNAGFDALTKDSPAVKLADACGIMRRVVPSRSGVSNRRETLDRRESHALVGPGADNTSEIQHAVHVVVVSLDARAREDVGLKVLDDLDVGSQRNITPGFGRALGIGVSIVVLFPFLSI